MTPDPENSKPGTGRHRFRRYHKAQARRRKAELEQDRFSRAVFSVAGVAAAIAIGLGVLATQGPTIDKEAAANLTDPWIGPASRMEVFGLGFIAIIAVLFLWRIRKRK
ncbi:MAG: hypothetical protein HKN36_02315 [Hellea sp.]|nr:hypothetical protein [Hellea sp.]